MGMGSASTIEATVSEVSQEDVLVAAFGGRLKTQASSSIPDESKGGSCSHTE